MGDAAKVLDWNGTDLPPELTELLAALPPGRYRLVAVEGSHDDTGDGVRPGDAPEGFTLTAEMDAKVQAGIRSARAGRVVSLEELDARLDATLARGARR